MLMLTMLMWLSNTELRFHLILYLPDQPMLHECRKADIMKIKITSEVTTDKIAKNVLNASCSRAAHSNTVPSNPQTNTQNSRDHGKKRIIRVLMIAKSQKSNIKYGFSISSLFASFCVTLPSSPS